MSAEKEKFLCLGEKILTLFVLKVAILPAFFNQCFWKEKVNSFITFMGL